MRVVDCEQGSAQWLAERVGRITASRVAEALSKYKREKKSGDETADRWNYKIDLIAERMTGLTTENFNSPEMLWGRMHESEAVQAYELKNDVLTESVGFILHPQFDWSGASPDALVGTDGGLEIKAPKTATHFKWYWKFLKQGLVPEEHQPQVLWNMACAEREWWDFGSYDPRVKPGLRLLTARMYRDDQRIKEMEAEAERFNGEVSAMIAELDSLIDPLAVIAEMRIKQTSQDDPAPEDMSQWAAAFGELIP